MKILMFGSDPTLLDENSFVRKRMEKYGEYLEALIIVLLLKSQKSHPTSLRRSRCGRAKFPPDFATTKSLRAGKIQNDNSKVKIFIAKGRILRFVSALLIGYKILRNEKFDLITAQDIEHGLIAFILSRLFHTPFQQQIHTDIGSPYFWKFSFKNKIRCLAAKFLLKRASCIRVVSQRIKNFLVKNIKITEQKIAVIPIIPNITDTQTEPKKFPEFEKIILMTSRLAPEKNIGLALDAFAEIIKTHPKTGLVIVGDGPERKQLELKTTNYKLKTNVLFEGFQNNLASYYKAANVFLLTSWYEGWSISVVEAMYYGLPIVMTNVGLAGEAVKNNENGFVVEPGDKSGLAEALNKILADEEFAEKTGENNKKTALKFLNEEDYYHKIIESWKNHALKSG